MILVSKKYPILLVIQIPNLRQVPQNVGSPFICHTVVYAVLL